MSETAQIITAVGVAVAMVLLALKGVVWAFRCAPDSPNFRLPSQSLFWWREKN